MLDAESMAFGEGGVWLARGGWGWLVYGQVRWLGGGEVEESKRELGWIEEGEGSNSVCSDGLITVCVLIGME